MFFSKVWGYLDSDSDTDADMDELDATGEGDLNKTIDLDNDVDNANNNDDDTNNVNSNTNEVENGNIDFTNMEDVAQSQRKATFRSLDEITNIGNFDVLRLVENKQYNFSTANKQFQIKWLTKSRNIRNVGRQLASKIVEGEIGPLRPEKDVTTPLEVWQLFIKDKF